MSVRLRVRPIPHSLRQTTTSPPRIRRNFDCDGQYRGEHGWRAEYFLFSFNRFWNAGTSIGTITPTNTGGVISSCSISPSPPSGITFSTSTCVLTGTPTAGVGQSATNYSITATNTSGNSTATLNVTITTVPVIAYPSSPYTFTQGTVISAITPTKREVPRRGLAVPSLGGRPD